MVQPSLLKPPPPPKKSKKVNKTKEKKRMVKELNEAGFAEYSVKVTYERVLADYNILRPHFSS